MNRWVWIVLIALVLAGIVWYFTRKKTLPTTGITQQSAIKPAPGVQAYNGEVPSAPPPAPQDGVRTSAPSPASASLGLSAISTITRPAAILQNIPIVGGTAASVARNTRTVALTGLKPAQAIASGVNNALDHIPVVGKTLSAPGKVAANIGKKILSIF